MRFVSPLLRKVAYPALHSTGWLRRHFPRDGCAVVNYHGVLPPDPYRRLPFLDDNLVSTATLREHLRFLKINYNIIDPAMFRAWIENGGAPPPRSVLLTCDDGLMNNLSDMLPVFQSEGVQCLFFVTGASVCEHPGMLWYEELYHLLRSGEVSHEDVQIIFDTDGAERRESGFQAKWWRVVVSGSRLNARQRADRIYLLRSKCRPVASTDCERRWRLLNSRELRQLAASGMTIGAHTVSHPVLSECSEEEARCEIQESKTEIERVLGQAVWAFAYPFGNSAAMGDREVALARQAGFECAFVNVSGGTVDPAEPFALSRTHVTGSMLLAELEAHLSGFHTRLQAAVRG